MRQPEEISPDIPNPKNEITMSRFDDIKGVVDGFENDMTKFYNKGNKAAGTRARKGLQELRKLAQEVRLEIQDIKNKS